MIEFSSETIPNASGTSKKANLGVTSLIMFLLNRNGQTILIVTHDVALSKKVKRVVAIRDGKISSERVLKEAYADRLQESNIDWRAEETQEEYAIVDKVGRVQIPAELLSGLELDDNKVSISIQDGKVVISKPEA